MGGLGENWPIAYANIAPYYDQVNKLVGVFGTREGLEDAPSATVTERKTLHKHEQPITDVRGSLRQLFQDQ